MDVALFPWPMFRLLAERLKVGANTPSVSVVVAVMEPDLPVMVKVKVPTAALVVAVSVSVVLPLAGLDRNNAVTPLGRPDTERFTRPANPYSAFTST